MAAKRKYRRNHPDRDVAQLERTREHLGWSVERMARALEVPFRTYQKWLYTAQRPRHMGAILARAATLGEPTRCNCWEMMECGRGPGADADADADEDFPPCPAALDTRSDGINGGRNGGRICWAVSGTLCGAHVQGRRAAKLVSCLGCEFFQQVASEEGLAHFKLLRPGQTYREK